MTLSHYGLGVAKDKKNINQPTKDHITVNIGL